MRIHVQILALSCMVFLNVCSSSNDRPATGEEHLSMATEFDRDVAFMKRYTQVVVLGSRESGRVALSPSLQGRVMTSTSASGTSYGWINRDHFQSGDTLPQMNAFGGEERFWLGPEGGQYAIFFSEGKAFVFENWATPKLIDLDPFDLVSQSEREAVFEKKARLTNYSGFNFDFNINRTISVLEHHEIEKTLDISIGADIKSVGYSSRNILENSSQRKWQKDSGLLSIWLLGMFKPSSTTVVVIPYIDGPDSELGPVVNDNYFGAIPPNRLTVGPRAIFFKGDGQERGKIGVSPQRAVDVLGSYDLRSNSLTIVKYNKPDEVWDYVNSAWEIQDDPYKGDVINSYNDGPVEPGGKPLGPFYELETSSPALELAPGEKVVHVQYTFHFEGPEADLDIISRAVLGVSISDISGVFD